MTEKRDEPQRDDSEQKSDPDALRVQEGPLKQQGDALADRTASHQAKDAPRSDRPQPN